ncbi:hypothetical protein DLM78_13715 [Leptospira stimsonii]|uniref:Uncharacterized protein n=1 Tax=Leptospira stimsonii TaxID=2202203 RepID=A0A8B3CN62_9LEPT|nr:hypothetical protein DLM78_13715 [Leptospira stimsonii]
MKSCECSSEIAFVRELGRNSVEMELHFGNLVRKRDLRFVKWNSKVLLTNSSFGRNSGEIESYRTVPIEENRILL